MRWIGQMLRNWAWGLGVGLLGLCVTAWFTLHQSQSLQRLEQDRLELAARTLSDALIRRLDAYTEIAFGLRSLFIVNPATSRQAFASAVQRLDAETRYPGIKNIAFTRYVPAAQKQAFERAVRADTSLDPAGYPDFAIRPPGERPEYFVADFLWPQSGSQGIQGLDISAQPANLASMRYAMATGRPTASAPFDLLQEARDKTGFVVRVPVFASGPAQAFLGSVAVTLRVHDLLGALEKEGALQGLHLALTDVGSGISSLPNTGPLPLYAQDGPAGRGEQVYSQLLDVYGRQWRLEVHPASGFLSASEKQLPLLIGLTGSLISALLAALTGLLGKGRREARENLAATHALLQSVMDHVPLRIFWKDRDCRYLGCNQLFARDAGCRSAAGVVGRTDDELVWASEAALYRQADQAVMDSGQAQLRFVEPQTTPDGKTIWLQTSKVPLRNGRGEVVGILGVYDDITESRSRDAELEQHRFGLEQMVSLRTGELQTANRQLRDTQFAMDSVGIGIHWVDVASASLLDVNRFAAALLGYTVAQMRGMPLAEVSPSLDAAAFAALVERARREEFAHLECEQRRADGSLVPVELVSYYQQAGADTVGRLIVFVTDVTQRRANERELLRARQTAEAANIAKSAFLANMSHEIRTPLNAITGMSHLIRRSGVTPEQGARLGKIELAGDHLLEIINAILDLSKIEAGKLVLEEVPLDVGVIVANVASILQHQASARQLEIVIDNQLQESQFLGDPTRLQQGLLNFGSNAVKFSERGRVTIRTRLLAADSEGALIRFELEDEGIGIDPALLPRLFNAFEQADSSTTRQYGGTGLGLAITRKLAGLMGGEVGASSTPGQGSCFWFSARLRRGSYCAFTSAPVPGLPAETILARDYADRRLLLVEDDSFNQEIACILLQDIWPVVDLAEDGLQALEMVAKQHYDLILMDVQMPRMDGLEATRRIHAMPAGAGIPVIAMTANAFVEDRSRCLAAGMSDFVSKPVKPVDLYEIILKWLRR